MSKRIKRTIEHIALFILICIVIDDEKVIISACIVSLIELGIAAILDKRDRRRKKDV